jgi:Spy/CpxP family protein refolding chaperone
VDREEAARPPGRLGRFPSHERWARELGLSTEQQDKINGIFKNNDERIKELRTGFYKNLGDIRGQLKQEIDTVLSPEQKQKMEAMIQKYMEQRRKDSDKRDRSNESPRDKKPTKGE